MSIHRNAQAAPVQAGSSNVQSVVSGVGSTRMSGRCPRCHRAVHHRARRTRTLVTRWLRAMARYGVARWVSQSGGWAAHGGAPGAKGNLYPGPGKRPLLRQRQTTYPAQSRGAAVGGLGLRWRRCGWRRFVGGEGGTGLAIPPIRLLNDFLRRPVGAQTLERLFATDDCPVEKLSRYFDLRVHPVSKSKSVSLNEFRDWPFRPELLKAFPA